MRARAWFARGLVHDEEARALAFPSRHAVPFTVSTITNEKALELYYQNPTFGMFLLRLVSDYAFDHAVAGGPTSPGAGGGRRAG